VIAGVNACRSHRWPSALALAAASGAGLLLALPVLLPYIRFAAAGATRPLELVAQLSATSSGYLASTSRVWRSATGGFSQSSVNLFFPGVTATLLAIVGFVSSTTRDPLQRRRAWSLALIALVGFVLSLGPATMVYRAAYAAALPLHGIRAAARFGYLVLLVVAVSAGAGIAGLQRRWRASSSTVTLVALSLVSIEAWQGPANVEPFREIPHIYSIVRDAPGRVLLAEYPFYLPDEVFQNGEYVLNSTAHWRPLMNGYSGVTPDSYRQIAEPMWIFPAGFAIDAIHQSGVTHVMVHLEKFGGDGPAIERALQERSDFRLIAGDSRGHRLYRVIDLLR
jgi:hypothetical protein